MTTAAAIDRLVHHSVILELNVSSYRLEQAKQSKRRGPKTRQRRKRTQAGRPRGREGEMRLGDGEGINQEVAEAR